MIRTRSAPARLATTVALLAVLTVLAGCGNGSATTARDPGDRPDQSTSPSDSPSASPSPTVGSYPAYPHEDYDFTVRAICFCPDAGQPVRIEVRGGEVESAVWAKKGRGHAAGEPAAFPHVTIDDIVAAINDPDAARVDVTWPAGQEYPSKVYIDRAENIADEEIGYTLRDVVPLD